MTSTDDVGNEISDLEALEENIKIKLAVLQKGNLLEVLLMQLRSNQVWKDSKKSENLRKLGNQQYVECDGSYYINSAIISFTKSIAYAPLRSKELSLAYANRSALLMKARLYDDALVDIRRALKAGYPDRLKAKLFFRRALCLKAVNPTAESDIKKALENARGWLRKMDKKSPYRKIVTDTLNNVNKMAVLPPPRTKCDARRFLNGVFEENPEIIDASSSIAIKPMGNNKFGIIATRDIKPGEIISTQEPYAALLHEEKQYTNCWHCRDHTLSAIPCNSCVHAIFCSETCRDTAWLEYHNIECQIPPMQSRFESHHAQYKALIMRMMIRAVKEAGSIQCLKKIIQRIESDPDARRKGFTGSKFDGSKLSSIYGLPFDVTQYRDYCDDSLSALSLILALSLATESNFFGEKMTVKRFYRHESGPFVAAVLMKFFLILMENMELGYDAIDSSTTLDPSLMLVPLHSHIAHSCAPNVSRCFLGSKEVIYAHYPIKRSEQIFLYKRKEMTFFSRKNSEKDLQVAILQSFGCSSWCSPCTKDWPNTDSLQCNISPVSKDLLLAHETLLETIDERLDLAISGHFAVIAKLINDVSVIISNWWNYEHRCSLELAQAVTLLNRIFFMLGDHREFFQGQSIKYLPL